MVGQAGRPGPHGTVIAMKRKHWIAGLLGVLALGFGVQQAHAWFCKGCCCNKYSTYICCRPYNAFSPVCFGSICCDGCCPLQTCAPPSYNCRWSPSCATPPFCPPGM